MYVAADEEEPLIRLIRDDRARKIEARAGMSQFIYAVCVVAAFVLVGIASLGSEKHLLSFTLSKNPLSRPPVTSRIPSLPVPASPFQRAAPIGFVPFPTENPMPLSGTIRRDVLVPKTAAGNPNQATLMDIFDFQRGDEGILWVPESAKTSGESEMLSQPSTVKEVVRMPLFPLSVVYLPGSKEILNIFEPRYRKMYTDILHNGSKRFAVALTNNGRITEYGVCLHIDDIQDVAEQTNDQIKYRCTHTVRERVRVLRILNPEAIKDTSKYLQVEVEVLLDSDEKEDISHLQEEAKLTRSMFEKFVELQTRYNETVRFNQDVVKELTMDREGLWRAIGLWKTYMTQMAIQKEKVLQDEITDVVKTYFTKTGKAITNEPIRVNFDELPKSVQDELNLLTQRFQADTDTMGGGPYPFQRLIQLKGHAARLDFFKKLVKIQQHRLMAAEMLRNFEREKDKRRGERKKRKSKRRRRRDEDPDDSNPDSPPSPL
mmetsp:Transcript_5333/g.12988  ORF Transcript_5333/g.12988 Transcript_5333/m.12988 type:complete len:488 (-) Transcript_5333:530-1993(-)|eukprot:CAMPEP_0114522390 /NCGR_PEP_ID=MMETSP0109-20121206/20714_1 /TAXON_ID=29199 /ORGANISM="Chlorarachnion reptans, Strain CCCM449" /LENGTH=487 /DNA_ID=CAMNT_0001703599 /DNA_START=232 /DNA_END=1695 /DNA_ORIENTATION=+